MSRQNQHQSHSMRGLARFTMARKLTQGRGACAQVARAQLSTSTAIASTSSHCSSRRSRHSLCTLVRTTLSASATGQLAQGSQTTPTRHAQRLCLTRSSNKQLGTPGQQHNSNLKSMHRRLAKVVEMRTIDTIGRCAALAGIRFRWRANHSRRTRTSKEQDRQRSSDSSTHASRAAETGSSQSR